MEWIVVKTDRWMENGLINNWTDEQTDRCADKLVFALATQLTTVLLLKN
jgi:hypothetical protein